MVYKKIILICYYTKKNRYSFNALAGAIEINKELQDLRVLFPVSKDALITSISNSLGQYEKVIVGISFTSNQLWDIRDTLLELRKRFNKKLLFFAGGPHPTGDPKGTLKLGFDVCVMGEGEETFPKILIKVKEGNDYKDINGIAFIDEDRNFIKNKPTSSINLDDYPPFSVKYSKLGPIEITRGCPFLCYFCQTPFIFGTKSRHRSIESVIKYVEISKNYGFKDIRFISPNGFLYGSQDNAVNFTLIEDLLNQIRKTIGPEGRVFFGSFPSEVRPENINEDLINLILKYANNDNLIIGAQSGSQKVLDYCNRGHTVEDIYNAVRYTLNAGLKANVDFIFGLPNETKEDVKQNLSVIDDLTKLGARIHAHTFIPLPGTPFQYQTPTRLSKYLRNRIRDLVKQELIYGDWRQQERFGTRIMKYFAKSRQDKLNLHKN
ncbi:MAG: TIGR04013 family B12-binding domain/radical SAM domain-containing protein [Candidatus Hermodarchaeota archaeon]